MGNAQSTEHKGSTSNSPGTGVRQQHSSRPKDGMQPLSRTTSRQSSGPSSPAVDRSTTTASPSTGKSGHSRARSITAPGTAPPRTTEPSGSHKSNTSINKDEERAIAPAARSSTLPIATKATQHNSPATRAVDVPTSGHPMAEHDEFIPSGLEADDSIYGHAPSDYSRPPRLPLPIEEEVHTPGSPIISPQDVSSPIDEKDGEDTLPRRTSVLSSTTVDDDEIAEHELYGRDQPLAPTVPTLIEWKGPGEKVYVTGTFVMWEKKFKLHRNPKTGHFSAVLALKPGTHHVKFLVDNDMITSYDLPTTVDFTNILVNYIEVVAPPSKEAGSEPEVAEAAAEKDLPGTAITEGQAVASDETASKPIPIRTNDTQAGPDAQVTSARPQSVRDPVPIPASTGRPGPPSPSTQQQSEKPPQKPARQILPQAEYTTQIPQFMLDLDRYQTPEDERYQRAFRVSATLQTPPSLPLFLAKSILNGATPHKDDASVLNMPNHTVLNHLATSSIRQNVLATSGTTRYKRKFLTTIMYRPTSEDG